MVGNDVPIDAGTTTSEKGCTLFTSLIWKFQPTTAQPAVDEEENQSAEKEAVEEDLKDVTDTENLTVALPTDRTVEFDKM